MPPAHPFRRSWKKRNHLSERKLQERSRRDDVQFRGLFVEIAQLPDGFGRHANPVYGVNLDKKMHKYGVIFFNFRRIYGVFIEQCSALALI